MRQSYLIALLGGVFLSPHLIAQDFRSFVGASNTVWESPSNWNPNLVPDSISEGARIDNGSTVIVGGSHVISAIEIMGGSIAVNQNNILRTSSLLIGSAGSITGPGTLIVDQSGIIDDGSGVIFSNVTFRNEGSLALASSIALGADAVFENVNTTNFFDSVMIGISGGAGAPGRIVNTGFLRKDAGAGTATIGRMVDNDNQIVSTSGTLVLSNGIDSSGQLRTEAGGIISLTGTNTFTDGASIFGDGLTQMTTGSIDIPTGATVSFDNFSLLGGQIMGDGVVNYEGPDNVWGNGNLVGNVTSRIISGAVVSVQDQGSNTELSGTHGIEVLSGGKLSFPDEGSLLMSNGMTTLVNHGAVEFSGDGDISQNGSGPNTLMQFLNAADGSVVKLAGNGDSTQMVAEVTSAGEWQVLGGEMEFFRKVDFSAPIEVSSGASVVFNGGSQTPSILRAGSGISGEGIAEFRTVMEIAAGATVDVDQMELSSGTLNGGGMLRILNDGIWSGGQLGGAMTLRIQPDSVLHVDGSGNRTIASSSSPFIDNAGTLELTGTGEINSNGAATLTNSGTLLLSANGEIRRNSGTNTPVMNTGTITKESGGQSGSSATSFMQIDLDHSGIMEVRSGVLTLQGDHTLSAPVSMADGAIFRLDGSNTAIFENGSSIIGDGTFEQRSTELVIAAGARVPISNYTTTSGSGRVTGLGTLVIANDTTLTRVDHQDAGITEIPVNVKVTAGSNFRISGGRTLQNMGDLTFPQAFNSTAADGANIVNDGVIEFNGACSITHGGNIFSIRNDGVIRCNAGGTSFVNLPPDAFSGNGRLEITSGRLRLTRPVTLTGTTELSSGTQLTGGSSGVSFASGSVLSGNGTVIGPVAIAGTASPGQSIGSLAVTGAANFTSSGVLAVELGNGISDQLVVTGALDLGGLSIVPSFVSGFTATPGAFWDIGTADSFTGSVGLIQQTAAAQGFGFFLSVVGNQLRLTYSAVDNFQKAYEAATGTSLGLNPDLNTLGAGDIDNDGRPDLLDWAFGGTLSGPDPGRELIIDPGASIVGGMRRFPIRYPINPLATDVTLSLEKNPTLDGPFDPINFTPTGTSTINGILFQQGTLETEVIDPANFFRLRVVFTNSP